MKFIKSNMEILDPMEEQQIHDASLDVLKTIGILMPEGRILKLFEAAGAEVDPITSIVRIPEKLIESVLHEVRKSITESPTDRAISTLKITVTPQPFIIDYPNQLRRYGTLDDVVKGILIANRMRHLDYANPIVTPSDVPASLSDLYSYQILNLYANKPGDAYINSEWSANYVIEMAQMTGRNVAYLVEPVSPLRFAQEHLRLAILFAEKKQRLAIGPMVIAGLSGPVTLAGTLVIQNAEILASIVLVYLLGAPCIYQYSGGAHTVDLRSTMCSFGSPNQVKLVLAERQLSKRYGLPCLGSLALSDSILPDFQMGFEKGISAGISAMAGVTRVGNQGHVGADQAASLEQMVIDDEWTDYLNYILSGFEVNEETIGMDVIRKVGIEGSFLAEDHTVQHGRANYWRSDLFSRLPWDSWHASGGTSIYDRANEKVRKILAEDSPPTPHVSEETSKEMENIIQHALKFLSS